MKRKRGVAKRELSLVKGALAIALNDELKLPLENIAEEIGLKVPRLKQILKARDEYDSEGPRLFKLLDVKSKEDFLI